jgi:hypothetical protein
LNHSLEDFYLLNVKTGFQLKKAHRDLLEELIKYRNNLLTTYKNGHETPVAIVDQYGAFCLEKTKHYIVFSMEHLIETDTKVPDGFKGFYIKQLFDQNKWDELQSLPSSYHIADYGYYSALMAKKQKRYKEALTLLENCLSEHNTAEYTYTDFYDDKTLVNIRKNLLVLFLKRGNFIRSILQARELFKTRRQSVFRFLFNKLWNSHK